MGYRLHQRIRHVPADIAADKHRSTHSAHRKRTDHRSSDKHKRRPVTECMA
ncbi:hypothetical protein [Paenarthrobacter sp. TYUT067]|uniref:hypothetical protein n=1 Tax=Paenarthrobacter sp. TYUT067 TaxID=2926245 RepID=UPI00202FAB63|nr:hypothetical protein [Paenarthrobacter sp. TYUT067]